MDQDEAPANGIGPLARRWAWAATIAVWAVLVVAGLWWMMDYGARPGDAGAPPTRWPAAAPLAPGEDRPTLVMLAHPRCPCTAASVEQLAQLMRDAAGPVRAYFVLSRPVGAEGGAERWSDVALRAQAQRIPGVEVVYDETGAIQRAMGAETSGHVLLFDARGSLGFTGGLTAARSHVGDSYGQTAVLTRLARGPAPTDADANPARAPVFGCPIDPSAHPADAIDIAANAAGAPAADLAATGDRSACPLCHN